jgi:SAM-dependent methyltransferase
MGNYRAFIKDVFYKTKLITVLDFILYRVSYWSNRKKNLIFKKANPALIIPPDYFLYETYRLDYEAFFKDGEGVANEIIEWTKKYIPPETKRILDWGCGVGRVVIHIDKFTEAGTSIHGCDINEQMISFNKKYGKNISYSLIAYTPPTNYKNEYFDLIYGLSILTHIEPSMQENWIREIYRMLNTNGIFLFTTHGRYFYSKLLQSEKQLLDLHGVFSKTYSKKGHRMMSTYNSPEALEKLLEKYFEILEFHDGEIDQSKTGGQDLWIVKKLPLTK